MAKNSSIPGEMGWKFARGRKFHRPALTQEELASKFGVSRDIIGKIENGTRSPSPELVRQFAVSLEIPEEWFSDGEATNPPVGVRSNLAFVKTEPSGGAADSISRGDEVLLPVWRGVLASPDSECEFYEGDSPEFTALPSFLAGNNADTHAVCIIAGSSMYPRVKQGERVVIRYEKNPPENSIVAVFNPATGAIYLKALKRNGPKLELHSLNAEFDPITDIWGWEFRGFAVAMIHDYEPGKPNIEWDNGRPLKC